MDDLTEAPRDKEDLLTLGAEQVHQLGDAFQDNKQRIRSDLETTSNPQPGQQFLMFTVIQVLLMFTGIREKVITDGPGVIL